jgi:5'-AMP-activated protein kinase regulatory beta subunit
MFEPNRKKGTVQFSIKPPIEAAEVYLAGGWRGWKPVPMKKQQDGRFTLDVRIPRGTHEYKFLIDGQWITDPDHSHCTANPYGSLNSVARVE